MRPRSFPHAARLAAVSLAASLGGAGCDDERAPSAAAATAKPAPTVTSFASLGEAPIPFASVLAYSRGGQALHLLASTHTIGCDDLEGAYVREAGEVTVELTVAPLVNDDRWATTRLRLGSTTRQGDLGAVTPLATDPKKTVKLEVGRAGPWGEGPRAVRLGGAIEATGCGVRGGSSVPPRSQPDLRLAVAGRDVVVRAATFDVASRTLRLSTEPHDCRGGVASSDLALSLTLGDEGGVERAKLEGYRLVRVAGGKTPDLSATPAEGEEAQFALAGKAVVGGYAIDLSGTVEATRCLAEP